MIAKTNSPRKISPPTEKLRALSSTVDARRLPIPEKGQCLLEYNGRWTLYGNVPGGLEFKRWYKATHNVWPRGKWPYYEESR